MKKKIIKLRIYTKDNQRKLLQDANLYKINLGSSNPKTYDLDNPMDLLLLEKDVLLTKHIAKDYTMVLGPETDVSKKDISKFYKIINKVLKK